MVYDISCKAMFGSKPLRIRFDEVGGSIRVYDGIRYLVLFGYQKYDPIYNKIRYLINQKKLYYLCFFHNYVKIKIDSYDSLLPEKMLILGNVVILKSIF